MSNYNVAGCFDYVKEERIMVSVTEKEMKKLQALVKEVNSELKSAIETAYFEGFEAGRRLNPNIKEDGTKVYEPKKGRWEYRPLSERKQQHEQRFDPDYYADIYRMYKD